MNNADHRETQSREKNRRTNMLEHTANNTTNIDVSILKCEKSKNRTAEQKVKNCNMTLPIQSGCVVLITGTVFAPTAGIHRDCFLSTNLLPNTLLLSRMKDVPVR